MHATEHTVMHPQCTGLPWLNQKDAKRQQLLDLTDDDWVSLVEGIFIFKAFNAFQMFLYLLYTPLSNYDTFICTFL